MSAATTGVDPVTTEIVRQGLNAAADQMKRALVRTAFSPVIYEVLDFAAALYDRDIAMLAQAPSLPTFMGTMSFCVEAAVEAAGGADSLEPGDIVLYNVPYGTGSHPQDAAMVMPVFALDQLVGYAAIKAHWLDIGGKDPYSTDTVDVFQEGTIFPGVKLYRGGRLVDDIYRLTIANSRVPKMVAGDINATVVGVRTGGAALTRLVERHGLERFRECTERIYAHGEAVVRRWFEALPDGRYVGHGEMDSNGLDDEPVPFDVVVEIDGANSLIHVSEAATRITPIEVWEAKNPWIVERFELAQDSCGPGRQRGGLGLDIDFFLREDQFLTSTVERTKNAPWGLAGGGEARPNAVSLELPDGTVQRFGKVTRFPVPKGSTARLRTGGGGGYGDPAERDPAAVRLDVREGYTSEAYARRHYPHAFEDGA